MSTQRTSTPWLLAGVVVLGGVVLYRQFAGAPSAEAATDAEPSARERYLDALAQTDRQKGLLESAARWREALAATRESWDRASRELVRGRTQELAEAGFRERVLAEVKDLKFAESSANTVKIEATVATGGAGGTAAPSPGAAAPAAVRPIGLKVDVRTDSPAEVYRLIDRLEHMPDARAGVVSVEVKGPGLAQALGEVNATITVHALALIGEVPQ